MIFSDICSCSAIKHAPEYTLSCSVLHSCQGGSSYTSNQGGGRTLLRSRKQGCNHLFIHSSVYALVQALFVCSGEVTSVTGLDLDVSITLDLCHNRIYINFHPLVVIFDGVSALISTE